MTIEKRRLALLEETISHYTLKNRGEVNTNTNTICVYSPTPTSEGCAIGRLILDKTICKQMDELAGCVNDPKIIKLLPLEIQDFGIDFLLMLQQLHDGDRFWYDNGVNLNGMALVDRIKNKFC